MRTTTTTTAPPAFQQLTSVSAKAFCVQAQNVATTLDMHNTGLDSRLYASSVRPDGSIVLAAVPSGNRYIWKPGSRTLQSISSPLPGEVSLPLVVVTKSKASMIDSCIPALTGDPGDGISLAIIRHLQGLKVLSPEGAYAFVGNYTNMNQNDLVLRICLKAIESTPTKATYYVGQCETDSGIHKITVEQSSQGWAVTQYS